MNKHWQWGHPDDWSYEAWTDYLAGPRRRRRWNWIATAALVIAIAAGSYWLGVGW
jgi:hypothetical protein